MTPDLSRWPEADGMLDEALALPASDREAYVRRAAAGDPALVLALLAVLAESDSGDGFLAPAGALSGVLGSEIREALGRTDGPAALEPGMRFDHYRIDALIGRGGMGEVYRARDTRLNRAVALKVLPDRFARDPARLARFRREAQLLATLSHPGIAGIHGLAEEGDIEALVLELVEGPTLAERIVEGPLPLDEVLDIARQLVDAIDAAHAVGVLHRDLKPANVKIAGGGRVKVLDFGLAKALWSDVDVTSTATDLTGDPGRVLLGTAPYMSPEQARGRGVDVRTDIWAFGCVLFEMLTARRAFPGQVPADVLARVLEREPAYGLLPAGTPPSLRRLLRRCLEKDPARRLGYIGDARLELDEADDDGVAEAPEAGGGRTWTWPAMVLVALAVVAAGGAGWLLGARPAPPTPDAVRFELPLPPGSAVPLGYQPVVAASPDGRTIVFRASVDGVSRLYRRRLDSLEATPVPGTEEAIGPFFSPDGRWLGFDDEGTLTRVPIDGGTPVAIGPAPGNATSTWLPDDTIVFATNTGRVLQRMPVSGGPVTTLTALDTARGDTLHLLPQALPDGRTIVYTIVSGAGRRIALLDLESGRSRVVTEGAHGRYLPDGRLLFLRDGNAWVAPLDVASGRLAGDAVPVVNGVQTTDGVVMHLDASATGTIVYLPARLQGARDRLAWMDRSGRQTPIALEPRAYARIALAPDDRRVAMAVEEDGNTDVWVGDLERGTVGRLTLDATIETAPVWSPDGTSVAFRSEREGPGLFRRDAQGAGVTERLTSTDGPIHSPYSWTPDGRTLLFALFRSFRNQAIASVTPPSREVTVLLDGTFAQLDPQVSPDGRWLAYQSDETGRFEVYVRPYPDVQQGRWQVSVGGGTTPRWSPAGGELFYYDGGDIVSVATSTERGFRAAEPRRLFALPTAGGRLGTDFEVASDGRRFLVIVPGPPVDTAPPAFVVLMGHR